MLKPPSVLLKEIFDALEGNEPDSDCVEEAAQKTLLPPEVRMWFDHLKTVSENRKRGARKAAETRRQKQRTSATCDSQQQRTSATRDSQQQSVYFCGTCHGQYKDFTDVQEKWIACESCEVWFHFVCVGLDPTETDL